MWAAKRIQTKIAIQNAVKIRAALKISANRKQIAEQFEAVDLQPSSSPTQDNAWVRSWALLNVKIDTKPLKKAVERSVAEGWVTGQKAADHTIKYAAQRLYKASIGEIVSDPTANVWKDWKPGDAATAALLARPYGLQILLATAEKDIKGIERTMIDQIGTRLAEGKRQGLSIQDMADSLSGVIDNPARALTIATTEVSRAVNTSAQTRYQEAKLTKNQWMGIDPCDTCAQNDGEIVEIGAPFASGDTQPPAHPNCLCTLLPVISKEDFVDRTEEGTAATDALFEESIKREEELTPVMMAVSQATNGTISGLRFRLKQPGSLRRKIVDQVEKGEYATAKESAENISDAVRYTISYDSKNYVKSVAETLDDMRTRGYELRVKNYWDRADYKGINIAVKDKTGKTFELQLHTKESLAIKEDLHVLYEQYRKSKNDAERWQLWNKMTGIAKKIPQPEGFADLLKIGTLKYEQFTDSKGVVRRAGEGIFKPVKIPAVKLPPVKPVIDEINPIDMFPQARENILGTGPRTPQVAMQRYSGFENYKEYTKEPDRFYAANIEDQLFSGREVYEAVLGYQSSGYRAMNQALRKDLPIEPFLQANIQQVRNAITQAVPLKEDTVLYRGVKKDFDKFKVGQIISDKGFLSTTARSDLAAEWADRKYVKGGFVWKIYAPAGTRGLVPQFVTATKNYDGEYEFLFDIGAKFEVISIDPVQRIVEMRVING